MIIVGDLHGALREIPYRIEKKVIPRGSNIIQVGDLGLGFHDIETDTKNLFILNEICKENECHFYAIRGNHDDKSYWYNPELSFSNLELVLDYTVKVIEGSSILFIGGGISIDRVQRKIGKDYWEHEIVVEDIERVKDLHTLYNIDTIITHIAPTFVWPTEFNDLVNHFIFHDKKNLKQELIDERVIMNGVYNVIHPKSWYYGHYHKNVTTKYKNTEFNCIGIGCLFDTNENIFL